MSNFITAVFVLLVACAMQSVSGQAQSDFQTMYPNISTPTTRYLFSVACEGVAVQSLFRFATTPTCGAGLTPACTLQSQVSAQGRFSWGCVGQASVPTISTTIPSPVTDVCDAFVDITCTNAGSTTVTYQVSTVIGGAPQITNATSPSGSISIIVGSAAEAFNPVPVLLRGSNIPGNLDEVSNHMSFRWAWYRSLTENCNVSVATTFVNSISDNTVIALNVSAPGVTRSDGIDGCTLELAGVSRRGVDGNFTASSTRRIAVYVQSAPKFTVIQPTRGYYLTTLPATVDVSLTGTGLPRSKEAVFVRTSFNGGSATPNNVCNQATLSDAGSLLGCRYVVSNLGASGLIVANVSLLRQNVPQLSDWTLVRFFNTLPQIGDPTNSGGFAITGIQSYFEGTAVPTFYVAFQSGLEGTSRGDTAVRQDTSTCPQYFVTCTETSVYNFACEVRLNFAYSVFLDCRVNLIPYKWDVAGAPTSIVVLQEPPYIALMRPNTLIFSPSRPFAIFEVVGTYFNSSDPIVTDAPSVVLSSGASYSCQVINFTMDSIFCNISLPMTASGRMFDLTVTRYSVSRSYTSAAVVRWLPSITLPSSLSRLDPFDATSSLTISGERLCTSGSGSDIWAQIVAHPQQTTRFPACDSIGQNMTTAIIMTQATSMTFSVSGSRPNNPNCALSVAVSCFASDPYSDPAIVAAFVQYPLTFVPLHALAVVGANQPISSITINFVAIDYDSTYSSPMQLYLDNTASSTCSLVSGARTGRETNVACTLGAFNAPTTLGASINLKVANAVLRWGVVVNAPSLSPAQELLTVFDAVGSNRQNASVVLTLYNMATDASLITDSITFEASLTAGADSTLKNCPSVIPPPVILVSGIGGELTATLANFSVKFTFASEPTWDGCTLALKASLYQGYSTVVYPSVTKFVARPFINETWGETGQVARLNGDGISIDLQITNVITAFTNPVSGLSFTPTLTLTSNCSLNLPTGTSFIAGSTPQQYVFLLNATAFNIISLANLRSRGIDGCAIFAKIQRTALIGTSSPIFVGHVAVEPLAVTPLRNDRIFTNIMSSFNISGEFLSTPNPADYALYMAPRSECNIAQASSIFVRRSVDGKSCAMYFNVRQSTPVKCNADVVLIKYGVPVWFYLLTLNVAPTLANPTPGAISARVLGTHGALTQADQLATSLRPVLGLPATELTVALGAAQKREVLDHETVVITFSGSNGRNTYDNIVAAPESLAFFTDSVAGILTAQAGTGRSLGSVSYNLLTPTAPPADSKAPSSEGVANTNNYALSISLGVIFSVLGVAIIVIVVIVILRRKKAQKKQGSENSAEMADKQLPTNNNSQYGALKPGDSNKSPHTYGSISTGGSTSAPSGKKGVLQVDHVEDSGSEVDDDHLDNLSKMMQSEFDSKWYIPFEDIKFLKVLGRGAYGQVHKAKWNGGLVAVKQTMALQIDQTGVEEVKHEAKLLLNLQPHPNVVQVFGISINNGSLFLIMEYCGLGSLDKYVVKKKLDVTTKVSVLSECARGLYHLHTAGIVHRDIAMRNILVGQGGVPKISDFGMSRTIVGQAAENKTASNVGPLKWMSPESLRDRIYGTKTDVYTYGVLISEVFTEKEPFPDMELLQAATQIRDNGLVPELPAEVPPPVADIAHRCWNRDPDQRPDMKKVVSEMSDIVSELRGDDESDDGAGSGESD
eukprot:TRINITY_DN13458_c0_g1_i1.p1 TRINITY_DN13458_c0_g1~~TRINITY_DN13458_c0_g1_i1.p1  ORF type:complete len:1682 (+),score=231.32 TRINITY_DN13458_c0_g1_i1:195-5240(+)